MNENNDDEEASEIELSICGHLFTNLEDHQSMLQSFEENRVTFEQF